VVRYGYMDAALDVGVDVTVMDSVDSNGDTQTDIMAANMASAAWSQQDGAIVSILNEDVYSGITELIEDNVPVISMNSGSDVYTDLGVSMHVGQDEYEAGRQAGVQLRAHLESGGVQEYSVVCIDHEPENGGTTARCQGFQAAMEPEHNYAYKDMYTWSWNSDDAIAQLKSDIQSYIDDGVHAFLTLNSGIARYVWEAVDESGSADTVDVATFDWDLDVIDAIDQGKLLFAIDQQQYLQGYIPPVLLYLKSMYDLMPADIQPIYSGPHFISSSEVSKYKTRDYSDASTVVTPKEDIRIAVVVHGHRDDTFWYRVMNGVKQAGRDFGVRVDYRHPTEDDTTNGMAAMAQIVTYYRDLAVSSSAPASDKIDGLVISIPNCDPSDADAMALQDAVRSCLQNGISVISVNSGDGCYSDYHDGAVNKVAAHIGQAESDAGTGVGNWITSKRTAGSKILCLIHEEDNSGLVDRCNGISAVVTDSSLSTPFEFSTANIPGTLATADDIGTAITNAGLTSGDLVVALGPTGAGPALQYLKANPSLNIDVGTFDLDFGILESLAEGGPGVFCVDQQQYYQGYLPVMFHYLNAYWGNQLAEQMVHTGPAIVDTATSAQKVLLLVEQQIR